MKSLKSLKSIVKEIRRQTDLLAETLEMKREQFEDKSYSYQESDAGQERSEYLEVWEEYLENLIGDLEELEELEGI